MSKKNSTHKPPLDLSKLSTSEFPYKKKLDRGQEDMVIKLFKGKRVIVDSVAGSGKTSILTQAMKALKDKNYVERVYYIVFPVQEGSLGYLPGGVPDKIKEYAVPFYQALIKAGVNPQHLDIERMCDEFFEDVDYRVVPHTYLRGRTIENAGVIIDEAQNGREDELQKTFTRLDDSCYVAVAGHRGQTDIENSGFPNYIRHFKIGKSTGKYSNIEFAKLTQNYRGDFSAFADKIGEFKNVDFDEEQFDKEYFGYN